MAHSWTYYRMSNHPWPGKVWLESPGLVGRGQCWNLALDKIDAREVANSGHDPADSYRMCTVSMRRG